MKAHDADFIVIGAGAAGSAMAYRLGADRRTAVLVLEAGPADRNLLHQVPKGYFYTLRSRRFTYRYDTEELSVPGGHDGAEAAASEVWLRGRLLGGSSAVNGSTYVRGGPADFDDLAARGNPDWAWLQAVAGYRAMEDHSLGESLSRGSGGPLPISVGSAENPASAAIVGSATTWGVPEVEDFNASEGPRVGFSPATIRQGRRVNAARAFLMPAVRRGNVTVQTGRQAVRLLFDGQRVTGVRVTWGRSFRDFIARRGVVICAGTVETPLLLERSGIGDPAVLAAVGIPVKVASPQVGERVIEHHGVTLQMRFNSDVGLQRQLQNKRALAGTIAKYVVKRGGPLMTAGFDVISQFKSEPGLARTDVQAVWAPFALNLSSSRMQLASYGGLMFTGYGIRPETHSSIHVSGPSPLASPIVRPRYFGSAADRRAVVAAFRIAREVCSQGPLADLIEGEDFPGSQVRTDSEVLRFATSPGATVYHAVGSAAMGPQDDDVVDSRLAVRGASGLWIADLSVYPTHVSPSTAAPAMLAGWLGADFVREDA